MELKLLSVTENDNKGKIIKRNNVLPHRKFPLYHPTTKINIVIMIIMLISTLSHVNLIFLINFIPKGDNSSYSSKLVILPNRNFEDVIFFKKNMTITNFHK